MCVTPGFLLLREEEPPTVFTTRAGPRLTLAALLLTLLLGASGARAQPAGDLLHLLHFGSRPSLGLGGDPFLSPARAESGWWRQDAFGDEAFVGLRQRSDVPVTNRLSGGKGELELIETELALATRLERGGRGLRAGLFASEGKASTSWSGEDGDLGLRERGTRYRGLLRLEHPSPHVQLQLGFPIGARGSRGVAAPLRLGLRGSWRDRIWLHGSWSRSSYQDPVLLELEEERVDSPLNLDTEEFHYGTRLRLWRRLAVELRVRESDYRPKNELSDRLQYEFQPDAWSVLRQNEIQWRAPGSVGLLLRRTRMKMQGEGEGFWGGQRYLLLHHLEAKMSSWLLAGQIHLRGADRLLAEWEHAEFRGFGRAKFESWRFASWQTAWLNGERVFLGTASGDLYRSHVGYQRRRGARLLEGGLSWYELRLDPGTQLEAWSKLLFGREDEELHLPDSDHYSLLALSLGAELPLREFALGIRVHQLLWVDDHLPPGEETPEPPEPGEDDGPGGWFGGTWFEARLGWGF